MPAPSNTLFPGDALFPSDLLVPVDDTFIPTGRGIDTGFWAFVVCDRDGNPVGDPLATARQFNPGISTTETASFTVRVGSLLWLRIITEDLTLKVYDSAQTLMS